MKLRRIINASKTITDAGTWKSGVKMTKTVFPPSKSSSFKVSSNYNWRVIRFEAQARVNKEREAAPEEAAIECVAV